MTIRFSVRNVVSVTALVGLTACGGGGGTLGGGTTFGGLDADYDDLQTSANIVANLFATSPLPSGPAGFEGVMLIAEDLDPSGGTSTSGYLGKATLLVDFDAGTVDGSAGDFFSVMLDGSTGNPTSSITALTGSSADFDAIAIADPGATFSTPMTGTIDGQTLTGTGSGIFLGPDAALVQIIDASDGDVQLGGVDHNLLIRAD